MPTESGGFPILYAYALIFLIFWFLVFKPQKDKQKKLKELIQNLKKNDRVVTTAGIHGTIVTVKEKTVIVRVDENTKIEFDRESISDVEGKKDKK